VAMMAGPSSSGTGGAEPSPRKARPWSFLSVSSWYAHGVVHWFMSLPLLLFLPNFERWCWGGRSHNSSVLVVHRSMVHPTTSPRPPLVASSATRVSDLAVAESPTSKGPTSEAREALVLVTPSANGASQGATCVEVDGVGPS
jgi:hypothetical protein